MCNVKCGITFLSIVNFCLLVGATVLMAWSTLYIAGGVILALGSLVDIICLFCRQRYSLAWHVFLNAILPIGLGGLIYCSYDNCDKANTCHPIKCHELQVQCAFTFSVTLVGAVVEIIEAIILKVGLRNGISTTCCCDSETAETEMVLEPYYYQAG